jgi:hypothetical protein
MKFSIFESGHSPHSAHAVSNYKQAWDGKYGCKMASHTLIVIEGGRGFYVCDRVKMISNHITIFVILVITSKLSHHISKRKI